MQFDLLKFYELQSTLDLSLLLYNNCTCNWNRIEINTTKLEIRDKVCL